MGKLNNVIARQNDTARREINIQPEAKTVPCKVVMTNGIMEKFINNGYGFELTEAIAVFDKFTHDNDPYGEHDFASLEFKGQTVLFKIDYYDNDMHYGSESPSDLSKTCRALTIMLREEY